MNTWQFNQQYIKNMIDKGLTLLENPKMSHTKKKAIMEDVAFFSEVLKGNFEYSEKKEKSFSSLAKLKEYILCKMKKQYKILGQKLIDGIIALDNEGIFDFSSFDQTELSMDEQAELTLRNYEKHSRFLLNYARGLFSSKPTSQIQSVENLNCSSYCYYCDINELPFLIVDPTEMPSILNHEIQHGIEYTLNFKNPYLLYEQGSILFELLYLDVLFEKQNYLYSGDIERLDDTYYQLQYVAQYFKVMKEFAKTNFEVPMPRFLEIFREHADIEENMISEFLSGEIANGEIDEDLLYVLSLLKAIKLRNDVRKTNDDAFEVLRSHRKTSIFQSDNFKDDFKLYESFIDEMKQKSR